MTKLVVIRGVGFVLLDLGSWTSWTWTPGPLGLDLDVLEGPSHGGFLLAIISKLFRRLVRELYQP